MSVLKCFLSCVGRLRYTFLCGVLCWGIFAGIFALYGISFEVISYPALLSLFCIMVFVLMGTVRIYRQHKMLLEETQNLTLQSVNLPEGYDLIEQDYQAMVKKLEQIRLLEFNREQAAWEEMRDYYATWVHQIKAPIAVMRAILQSEDGQERQELLAELFRIEQYVEMALCYVRLDSNASDFVFEEVELDSVIRKVIRKYASSFIRKKLRLEYQGTEVRALTDEKWLFFMLEQLLSNAVKYTEAGTVTITVSDNKHITVRDTGMGIAPEDLPRIFEKGFTGYNGRADKKSTGLGLYLCRRIADKMGCGLAAVSEPGRGSAFTIDLDTYDLKN